MDFFHYCYNVFFILVFSFALSICFKVYGMTDNRIFKYYGELLILYTAETMYQGSIGIFGTSYKRFQIFLETGCDFIIEIAMTAVEAYVLAEIINCMAARQNKFASVISMLSVLLISLLGYILPGNAGLMLVSNIYGFVMIGLSVYYFAATCSSEIKPDDYSAYRVIIGMMAIFGVFVLAENINYIFANGYRSSNVLLQFYTKFIRWADDAFSLVMSVWFIWYANVYAERFMTRRFEELLSERLYEFASEKTERAGNPDKTAKSEKSVMTDIMNDTATAGSMNAVTGKKHSCIDDRTDTTENAVNVENTGNSENKGRKTQLAEFCRLYSLTDRESEIVVLMLEGKSNKEICELLSLSLGTVKVHVHSILTKLSISRRTQLLSCFDRTFGVK